MLLLKEIPTLTNLYQSNISDTIPATILEIVKEAVRPGESIPIKLIRHSNHSVDALLHLFLNVAHNFQARIS